MFSQDSFLSQWRFSRGDTSGIHISHAFYRLKKSHPLREMRNSIRNYIRKTTIIHPPRVINETDSSGVNIENGRATCSMLNDLSSWKAIDSRSLSHIPCILHRAVIKFISVWSSFIGFSHILIRFPIQNKRSCLQFITHDRSIWVNTSELWSRQISM